MNNGVLLFLGVLVSLATSFWGLILAPQLQLGNAQPVVIEATGERYPSPRAGLAQQGAAVYRSLGCAECHSQQVRQTGVNFEVWLADAGSEWPQLGATMDRLKIPGGDSLLNRAPVKLLGGLDMAQASAIAAQLTNGEARAQVVLATLGPDIARGWGARATVSQDFLYDYPVQVGSSRVGPDLSNYGTRPAGQMYEHLYDPSFTTPKSMMPPYRFLFKKRQLAEGEKPGPGALAAGLKAGYEITPLPEAEALVAYLMSLKANTPLNEAPVPSPPVKTVAAVPAAAPAP